MAPNIPATMRRAGPRLLATRAPLRRLPPHSPSALPLGPFPPARRPSCLHLPQLGHAPRMLITTTAPRHSLGPASWLLSALPNFSPNPSSQPQPPPPKTLRARRLLPYPAAQIYTLIADIDSYAHFLPHCTHSRVTRWATATGKPPAEEAEKRYPALADLTVGWGPLTQTYTSRVYCVPGEVVEAVSGRAETSIAPEVLRRVGYENIRDGGEKMEGCIFESLITRWTVKPAASPGGKEGAEWTEVTLSVTFQFANPALGFAVGQLADDKVDEMVEAFEGRARKLYGR